MNPTSKRQKTEANVAYELVSRPLTSSLGLTSSQSLSAKPEHFDKLPRKPRQNQENESLSADKLELDKLTSGHDQELVSVAPPLRGRQADKLADAPTSFEDVKAIRARLNDGAAWCQQRVGKPVALARGVERYCAILYREYLPALRALRADGHDYASDLATVETRITKGANVVGHDDLFVDLVLAYEVLYDILSTDALDRHADRVLRLQAA